MTTQPDYARLVLALRNQDTDGSWEDWQFYRSVDPEVFNGGEDDCGCESCYTVNGPRKGARVYGQQAYDDPELTIRQYQTGGDINLCEDCIADSVLGTYQPESVAWGAGCEAYWFAITAEYAAEDHTTSSYGGC